MAIIVHTDNPDKLLKKIHECIDNKEIETWQYDKEGDFTHSAKQWIYSAWLKPKQQNKELIFYIIPPATEHLSKFIYGLYHGRFIEMLLTHFDIYIDDINATSMPIKGDEIIGNEYVSAK